MRSTGAPRGAPPRIGLWDEWRGDLWEQDLYGHRQHILGPAHGFAGEVLALARGDLLDRDRRLELERRAVAVLAKYALRLGGLAQWRPSLEPSSQPRRTQWCHGAPGIVASSRRSRRTTAGSPTFSSPGRADLAGRPAEEGEPLPRDGRQRVRLPEALRAHRDELWLHRARAFAMHAIEQVERTSAHYGRGRHSLWTGDPGTALYLSSCLTATAAFPLDTF